MKIFYRCNVCGNLVMVVESSGLVPVCCEQRMEKLIPGKTDASREKHIPIYLVLRQKSSGLGMNTDVKRVRVQVGEMKHPMTKDHHISWIVLVTGEGTYLKELEWDDEPVADFYIHENEEIAGIYEYCNIHGLWLKDLMEE